MNVRSFCRERRWGKNGYAPDPCSPVCVVSRLRLSGAFLQQVTESRAPFSTLQFYAMDDKTLPLVEWQHLDRSLRPLTAAFKCAVLRDVIAICNQACLLHQLLSQVKDRRELARSTTKASTTGKRYRQAPSS